MNSLVLALGLLNNHRTPKVCSLNYPIAALLNLEENGAKQSFRTPSFQKHLVPIISTFEKVLFRAKIETRDIWKNVNFERKGESGYGKENSSFDSKTWS